MQNNSLDTLETALIVTASFFGSELGGDIGIFIQIIAGILALYKMIEMTRNWVVSNQKRKEERQKHKLELEELEERRKKRKEEREEHAIKMQKHKLELEELEERRKKRKREE